ncbi:TRCF domain-containing protein [Salinarimonas soli]|uniref:Transcription-repair-coupling factor n=1 Tax=Salinarimonas soli TaxID=1638099 RepID=A0A5B2VQ00_9HYPH|nr:TRCF domain-containing protein [Salinarimonas soli]KAA2241211.1 DEAD/DEAH box helicase [Salinarimonas soli]
MPKTKPAPAPLPPADAPLGLLAVRLIERARAAGAGGLVHMAAGESRAERLGAIAAALAPDLPVVVLPPWDCLPFDRASPSREAMGRRVAALRRLDEAGGAPRLLVATPDALLQRVPPAALLGEATVDIRVGGSVDPDELGALLHRPGYVIDERVDEPGEVAIRGHVIDVFPGGAARPYRIEHEDGRVTAIRSYDPVSQRTEAEQETLAILPVSELILPPPAEGEEPLERGPGLEHWLPDFVPGLQTVLDLLPGAALVVEPKAETRRMAGLMQVRDAHEGRAGLPQAAGETARPVPAPDRLYLDEAAWSACTAARPVERLPEAGDDLGVPRFVLERRAGGALARFVAAEREAGRRVVLAAATKRDAGRLARPLDDAPEPAVGWAAVTAAPKGALLALSIDLEAGFRDEAGGVTVVAAADLLGSRAETGADDGSAPILPLADPDLHLGDAVIHVDHGMAVLQGIEALEAGAAGAGDAVRLGFARDATLLTPATAMDRIWRYGADAEAVTLDRLDGEAWAKRRAALDEELADTAARLVTLARERGEARVEPIRPPAAPYERFVARFPYPETRDQARAIAAVLDDLASGTPMDRLVCGDVGYGKTEVALRAAAAVALSGRQVALVAPTTVLVRQHLQTVERRFADLGVTVGHLSRLVSAAEAKAVKAGLADGSIRVVVGTHALAAEGVTFADLGLVVIDEEQRFGAAVKGRLRDLGRRANVLTLTATPIPRTLQAALVGLQDLSLITTPPARRQPIRTFLAPFDPLSFREALLRERRRGGQSFVVCPRIEDIGPIEARLAEVAPDLRLVVAHGKMPAAAMDEAMVRFADGDGDVLLSTSIIESGLDVPRANTMLVWRADRFGLAQLHQLRGRVGRGRARGICYLLTEPGTELPEATRKRLQTLEALDRLGAGFAVSARDLDLRGAGELLGEEQAGHVTLVGTGLYQHLLERALRAARGEAVEDWTPELNLGFAGSIPDDYIPEPEVRLNLYARLSRAEAAEEVEALADEIADRFGALPDPMAGLFDLTRLRVLCRRLRVARIDAGPAAIALTFRPEAGAGPGLAEAGPDLAWKGERLILARAAGDEAARRALAVDLLDRIEAYGANGKTPAGSQGPPR